MNRADEMLATYAQLDFAKNMEMAPQCFLMVSLLMLPARYCCFEGSRS